MRRGPRLLDGSQVSTQRGDGHVHLHLLGTRVTRNRFSCEGMSISAIRGFPKERHVLVVVHSLAVVWLTTKHLRNPIVACLCLGQLPLKTHQRAPETLG
jgi:hypothetical protein